ncbi:MAG: hypothetical protein K2G13_01665, partial [Muribaculaceae bacterium]|nr:hypothetical protein [Muribaculaceae bacterium]
MKDSISPRLLGSILEDMLGYSCGAFDPGYNPDEDPGSYGVSFLKDLDDVAISDLVVGQSLVFTGTNWTNQSISKGLDASDLETFLSEHDYAKKSDFPSTSQYATRDWVQAQGYLTSTDLSDTYLTKTEFSEFKDEIESMFVKEPDGHGGYRIKALYGLYTDEFLSARGLNPDSGNVNGGGIDFTQLEQYLTNNNYAKTSDFPSLSQYATRDWVQAQGYLTITDLSDTYLTKTEFSEFKDEIESMFVKEPDGHGGYRIKALFGLYTDQFLSARGLNPDSVGSAVGLNETQLAQYLTDNSYLTVSSANALYQPKGDYLTSSALTGYATRDWVQAQGYLTAAVFETFKNSYEDWKGSVDDFKDEIESMF